ncbi:hypothetical protein [Candidatus Nitrosotenuis aquarius]|uniref:hypothetical protein n=1 Tax=Candidatus Nitrosotenuis aquarius TaxID=1846278 RepID=UPI000C1F7CD6|nr:hypothetical protein [Candidatus Nitrosotenuis aquarius]
MGKQCFVCHKELGALTIKFPYKDFLARRIPIPEGMSQDDVTCKTCIDEANNSNKEATKEAKESFRDVTQELLKRTPEYKKLWNKDGIIQFKNERIAILQRRFGAQVEFIIAYDDLTAEGYELKAIDEGKTADGQGISGGMNSYYYFQKNEYLK